MKIIKILIGLLVLIFLSTTVSKMEKEKIDLEISKEEIAALEEEVIQLTNNERKKYGLPELKLDEDLREVARIKSKEMAEKEYFSHESPTYGSPFQMLVSFGILYEEAGENIAQGQSTPEDVIWDWLNSEGHKENILNETFTHIGVGYEPNNNHWTQLFIEKK